MSFFITLLGCAPLAADAVALSPEATVDAESGTALTIRWTTEEPADAWLEYGTDEGYGAVVEGWSSDDGLEHAAVLAAVPGGRAWHWRVRSEAADRGFVSPDARFVPASPPTTLSDLSVAGSWEGLVLVPVLSGAGTFLALYNGDGRPVWWRQVAEVFMPITQARVSVDGRAVVYLTTGDPADPQPALVRLPIAGGPVVRTPVDAAHHDFVELEPGRYLVIAGDVRDHGDGKLQGDALLDVQTDGPTRTLWSTWDDLVPPADVAHLPVFPDGVREWTHLNSLTLDHDRVWVSSYALQSVLRVELATGLLLDQIGGLDSDYRLSAGAGFGPQHGPLPTEDGFVLFNNRPPASGDLWSEAAAFTLDEAEGTYARAWSYDAGREVFSPVFGNVEALGDGHLVGWGSAGRLSVLDADHAASWEADAPLGYAFGFAHPIAGVSAKP